MTQTFHSGLFFQMDKIEIKFPNVHAYEFDLSKFKAFGFTENRQVCFTWTDI